MRPQRFLRICALLLAGALLLLGPACTPWPIPWPRPEATATPLPEPTPPLPEPTPAVTPADLYIAPGDVLSYPGPELYAGDWVTLDVIPRNLETIEPGDVVVHIYRGEVDPANIVASGVAGYPTFDGQPRMRLVWAWDSAGQSGEVTLVAAIDPEDRIQAGDEDPGNNVVTFTVYLSPSAALPAPEAATRWVSTTTDCCAFYYLEETAADRDMPTITAVANEALESVEQQLGVELNSKVRIYFLARVIGHGGYAYDAVALSYLDRHYAGRDLPTVLRHEGTHVLDGRKLRIYPPALLREGLATWVAGGHFKPEPIPERAAALLVLDRYIPLQPLADDFYRQQHEIGYLEGAALVAYLVDVYGWESFWDFYNAFDEYAGGSAMLDAELRQDFGLGLAETEEAFLSWLEAHPPTPAQVRDLRDTVDLYDTIRRYQQLYDPAAYWLSGWMPNPTDGVERGIVADFLRHPRAPENIALETMLIAARDEMRRERFDQAEELLAAVKRVLDTGSLEGALAADYLAVVQAAAAAGYEAQQVEMSGEMAEVWAIRDWPALERITLQRADGAWRPAVGGVRP